MFSSFKSVYSRTSVRHAQPVCLLHVRALSVAALTLATGAAQAAGFTNGDFSSTAGWVLHGGASYGNTSSFPASSLPVGQAVAVLQASPSGPAASVTQIFDHTAPAYNISFDLAAPSIDAAMAILVTFNGYSQIRDGHSSLQPIYPVAPNATGYSFLPTAWVHVSFQNVAAVQPFSGSSLGLTHDELSISTLSPAVANSQLLIRNVVVDPIGAAIPAVPEPQTYALMLLGLGAVGAAARRKARAGVQ